MNEPQAPKLFTVELRMIMASFLNTPNKRGEGIFKVTFPGQVFILKNSSDLTDLRV